MKILYDSDVILDILSKNGHFEDSNKSLDLALQRGFEPVIVAATVPDFTRRFETCETMSSAEAREALEKLFDLFGVLDVTSSDCSRALEHEASSFEDALAACSAERNAVDLIVTRNKQGFAASSTPALTPQEFVAAYEPVSSYEYAVIGL